jgi:hypothetical protein
MADQSLLADGTRLLALLNNDDANEIHDKYFFARLLIERYALTEDDRFRLCEMMLQNKSPLISSECSQCHITGVGFNTKSLTCSSCGAEHFD